MDKKQTQYRLKPAVNSTFAGETIAMFAALADAEWAQIMIQDILDQTVTVRDTTGGTLPFQVVLRNNCTLSKRLPHEHSIDAKSVFDALIKECAGNRQDRRTAVDLAIVRETLKAQGSHIRWIPHPRTPADSMTKADPSAGNDALRHLLRTGKLVLDEETIRQSAHLGRTKAVSRRQLENWWNAAWNLRLKPLVFLKRQRIIDRVCDGKQWRYEVVKDGGPLQL